MTLITFRGVKQIWNNVCVKTCKFTINQLMLDFITKWGQLQWITKQGKCYYKVAEFFCIIKRNKNYYKVGVMGGGGGYCKAGQILLLNGAGIKKWSNYYKVVQYMYHMSCDPFWRPFHHMIQLILQIACPCVFVLRGQLKEMREREQ